MDLFTYLMAKKGHNTHRDLFSYLLGKNAGGSGTYTTFSGTSLNISNTLQAKIKNIALEGNTSQDGTPTPDTPIPIKVVTGEQNVEIKNKNLFDKSNCSNYRIVSRLTGELVQNNSFGTTDYIKVKANQTYYQSGTDAYYSVLYNKNKEFYRIIGTEKFTPEINGYIRASFRRNNIDKVQIEIGEVATTYVPYQSQPYPLSLGNIELARTNNHKDYIFKNEVGSPYYNANLDLNDWYLHKEMGKITLSNSDSFTLDSYSLRFTKVLDTIYEQGGYSNRYIYGGTYQATGKFEILSNSRLAFNYPDSNIDTVAELQTYLTTNELYMYLPLSTPTNTKITDTTLIQQLENINNNARSYKDTTIIECTSASADNETIGFSGEIKVTSVDLGNSLNTSLLSSNLQEETNIDDIQEEQNLDEIEEQNDEPIENEEIEEEVS